MTASSDNRGSVVTMNLLHCQDLLFMSGDESQKVRDRMLTSLVCNLF